MAAAGVFGAEIVFLVADHGEVMGNDSWELGRKREKRREQ